MRGRSLPARYATALYEAAAGRGAVEEVLGDLRAVVALLEREPEVGRFFSAPGLARRARAGRLAGLLAGNVDEALLRLMVLLVERNALAFLPAVLRRLETLVDARRGFVAANVVTASPLTREQEDALGSKLSALTGRRVRLEVRVDRRLLAGVAVEVGGLRYDGSLAGRLRSLSRIVGWAGAGG